MSDSITDRLAELQERISAESVPAPPMVKAPTKAPVKAPTKAPAKLSAKAPTKVTAKAPTKVTAKAVRSAAAQVVTEKVEVREVEAENPKVEMAKAENPKVEVAKVEAAEVADIVTPLPAASPVTTTRSPVGAGLRVMVALAVLLLAVAAGLGAAAVVKSRPATWEARSVVVLHSASLGDEAVAAGVARYREKVANTSFTAQSALRANMADREVREPITAEPAGEEALTLLISASTAKGALALANSAGITLALTVSSDQELAVASQADRLSATFDRPSDKATRVTPTDTAALLAGLLAGGAVLIIAGVGTLLGRPKRS